MRLKYNIHESGITLIALVITIVLLIILSTITINFAVGNGSIIDKAQGATQIAEQGDINEQVVFNTSMEAWANIVDDPAEEAGIYKTTTKITDGLNNEITIPGGFRLADDSGTNVEDGIVIEDESGNQFVWIPVGEYNVSTEISSTGKLTNNLARRTFTDSGATEITTGSEIAGQDNGQSGSNFYGEENTNAIANYQINSFINSATNHKGFYIGRYEQGGTGQKCQAGLTTYVNVNRNNAKVLAETMYSGNYYVASELITSYAYDTALNFICQTNVGEGKGYNLAKTTDRKYGNIGTGSLAKTGEYKVSGVTSDKYSNIYDMLGNCYEWTTEYSNYNSGGTAYAAVARGTDCNDSAYSCDVRRAAPTTRTSSVLSFRVQLYLK